MHAATGTATRCVPAHALAHLHTHQPRHPYLCHPTLQVGSSKKKVEIPLELCEFGPGQTNSNPSWECTAQMIKLSCVTPKERLEKLQGISARFAEDTTCAAFGVELNTAGLKRVPGRVLECLRLQYRDPSGHPYLLEVDQARGQWSMRVRNNVELRFAQACPPVKSWVVVSFVGPALTNDDLSCFAKQLIPFARMRGLSFAYPHEAIQVSK